MSDLRTEYRFFIPLAAGVIGITLLMGVLTWYINFLLLLVFFGALVVTRSWHDRGFYLVCSGLPLVIGCGIMNLWAGLFAVFMVAAIVCGVLGLLTSCSDMRTFSFFCGCSFLITLIIQFSNHVLLPLFILGGVIAIILGIQSVRMYQFRKHYAGA